MKHANDMLQYTIDSLCTRTVRQREENLFYRTIGYGNERKPLLRRVATLSSNGPESSAGIVSVPEASFVIPSFASAFMREK